MDTIAPEDFVNPDAFNADKYPLAVYTGGERYAYTITRTGDGAEALLRYVRQGGMLLVAGLCWPFYRPVDYADGQWVRSAGKPPDFKDDVDRYLRQQMRALGQTAVGNFNRYLGLNIAGEGTVQFEKPEEKITFVLNPEKGDLLALPETFPFPGSGDLRYRPASPRVGVPGATFEPLLSAVGESGKQYGPGIAIVRHSGEALGEGVIIYVWGTLMTTEHAPAIVRDVIRFAAKATSTPEDQRRMADVRDDAQALVARAETVAKTLRDAPQDMPARSYLVREGEHLLGLLGGLQDTILVRNFPAADRLTKAIGEEVSVLEGRVTSLAARTG